MDLVTSVKKVPVGGETTFGENFSQIPGGKGANQAVALGKLGAHVTMLGKVGNDPFADALLNSMNLSNINTKYIDKTNGATGIANILVEDSGENRIIVIPGANKQVDKDYIDKNIELIKNSDIILTQLEIPLDTVSYLLALAKKYNKTTILNPAPATKLSDEIIKNSDIIIPNETELEIITNISTNTLEGIKKAGEKLFQMGVNSLIVTLGSQGSMYMNKNIHKFYSAYKVKAIDTTAAGDSFIGGFLAKLENNNIDEAIEFGTKVSALAVTKKGAQTSIPTLDDVEKFKGVKNEKK